MSNQPTMTIFADQPLIGIPFDENGKEVVRYFSEEKQADQAISQRDAIAQARNLAGAWSDLDWDAMEQELDRIRHESKPTPLIDLDL
ncbi:MAG TPA: hypothetical protein VLG12_03850 [Candidatus Saccharimonadales bacterium]|nr:hypothetical protein [Candidatus Saccharimonadales bacterium]